MNILVVSASPEPKSFATAMAKASIDVMRELGHAVAHSDLYTMGWNPVASAADFPNRSDPAYLVYAVEQRRAVAGDTIAPDIRAELDKLMAADLLILNFPIYWYSAPAILKGWIDRVLVSGVCYGGRRIYDQGGLRGKRALVGVTIGGREQMFGINSLHGPIDELLRPILQGTLGYVGFDVFEPFIGWYIPYIDEKARQAILASYRRCLGTLDRRKVLPMPSMGDFTEDMRPKPPAHLLANVRRYRDSRQGW